jgi:hypothetical protein
LVLYILKPSFTINLAGMKSEKNSPTKDKTTKTNTKSPGSKKKSNLGTADTRTSAIDNSKARAGRGLANEGTITSYEAER